MRLSLSEIRSNAMKFASEWADVASERQRVEYLFDLYQKLVTPLTAPSKGSKRTTKAKSDE
jgi:hypothetical protein